MNGDSCSLVTKGTRLALSDMTNVPSKRGISSILSDLLSKSGDDSGKVVAREGSGVKFSKRLCLVVDDLVKESTRSSDNTNEGSSSSSADDDKNGFADLDNFNVKESQGETNAVEDGDSAVKLSQSEKDLNMTATTTGEDLAVTMNSKTSDSFSMSRCSSVGGMGIVKHDEAVKTCPCSFCLKAAYIWSDLHYQDIKGRLSVLKKSQKEASGLIQRNGKEKPKDIHGSENSNNSTNTETGLMGQLTSLFLNMEGILARESKHLQNSFVSVKDLRENCKNELEKASKTSQHNNT